MCKHSADVTHCLVYILEAEKLVPCLEPCMDSVGRTWIVGCIVPCRWATLDFAEFYLS